jgi:para-aminobenzoate synthetase/4-amino-4-deoxychorismate lyase
MRLQDGRVVRGRAHLERLIQSAEYFGHSNPSAAAYAEIEATVRQHPTGCYRLRLSATLEGRVALECVEFDPSGVNPRSPLRARVAHEPIASRDPFVHHKTSHRDLYERRLAAATDCDDLILVNERGELTELTIGNLVVEIDGRMLTPPRECGLLAGVFRGELLRQRKLEERVLTVADLSRASRIWRVSSLREWVPLDVSLS